MSDSINWFIAVTGVVLTVLIGSITYYSVVDSNNSKEIVTRAIERGLDPTTAACASKLSTNNRDVRNTCEKMAIVKGK